MCIGIPVQVLRCEPGVALCRSRGEDVRIDTSLVGAVEPGAWLMTFLGAAREVIGETAARRSLAAIEALEAIARGEPADLEAAFADLIGREPTLPDHLLSPGDTDR